MNFENNPISNENGRMPSLPHHERIGHCFDQLRGDILGLLDKETHYYNTVQRLETELNVYRRAYADLEAERKQFEILKHESDKQREQLENQLKGHRIITLIDGDGAIFSSQFIVNGQAGGHDAARVLSDSILHHLSSTYGAHQYQLWVYIFFNKRGLTDTFGRVGLGPTKSKFEDFIMGFNQASERFIMVDVGNAREAADAKIKALLEDGIRLPQTEKVIFAGCHDNGYVTTLRSQITAGFKQKIILLPSYTEIAAGITELELPVLTIPDLFIARKLGTALPMITPSTDSVISMTMQTSPSDIAVSQAEIPYSAPDHYLDDLPFASAENEVNVEARRRPSIPSSYSLAITMSKRIPTPDLDNSGSTTSSDGSDEVASNPRSSLTLSRSRHVTPNIPLSKHKPPPCTLFYLANCKHGATCKYSHDYLLEPEHYSEIRTNAKKSPCPAVNKGDTCFHGEECCYGHYCPLTTKCYFFKQGRCKFVGADMHKEQKIQTVELA